MTPCRFLVYNNGGYLEAVNTCAKLSMMKAVTEVKALPNYAASGEICAHLQPCHKIYDEYYCVSQQWVITDARHDSTSNAFHITVCKVIMC